MTDALPPRPRRGIAVAAFGVGWVLIAASTAGAVVAFGRTDSKAVSAAAAPKATSAPSASATTGPPTAALTTSAPTIAPTTPPSPKSTVTGSVSSDLIHSGDLRFFLLPVPSDASVLGDPDGKILTKSDIAADYGNSSTVVSILGQLNFKGGAYRDYQTGDAAYHVQVTLTRFDSEQDASYWFQGDEPNSKLVPFSIDGYSSAKGWSEAPDTDSGLAHLRGLYYRGDTVFEIIVTGQAPLAHSVLVDVMHKQIDRLTTGGR